MLVRQIISDELDFHRKQLMDRIKKGRRMTPVWIDYAHQVGALALRKRRFYLAHRIAKEMGLQSLLEDTAFAAHLAGSPELYDIARSLGGDINLLREGLQNHVNCSRRASELRCELGDVAYNSIRSARKKYSRSLGFRKRASTELAPAIAAVSALSDGYDVIVPVARAGLDTGFIFGLHGMPVRPARPTRKGSRFRWLGDASLEGKRVLITDDDIVSGKTLHRVYQEVAKHKPYAVDVLLNPSAGTNHIFPEGCGKLMIANDFPLDSFVDTLFATEQLAAQYLKTGEFPSSQ